MERRIVVPTAGTQKRMWNQERLEPSEPGFERLRAAVQFSTDPFDLVGGQRDAYSESEAVVYSRWFDGDPYSSRVGLIEARACCTARDMWHYARRIVANSSELKGPPTLAIVSYPAHRWRVKYTLRWAFILLDGRWPKLEDVESSERIRYSKWMETVLIAVTIVDPFWIWLGLPLVWLANRRTNE